MRENRPHRPDCQAAFPGTAAWRASARIRGDAVTPRSVVLQPGRRATAVAVAERRGCRLLVRAQRRALRVPARLGWGARCVAAEVRAGRFGIRLLWLRI